MRYIILVLFLVSSVSLRSQEADNTYRLNKSNIYYQTLSHYLKFITSDSSGSNGGTIDTMFVYYDTKTGDSLLSKIGSTEI